MRQRTKLIATACVGAAFSLAFLLYTVCTRKPLQELTRPQSGQGEQRARLQVQISDGSWPLELTLQEVPYTQEEIEEALSEASRGLEELFLNGNQDLSHITGRVAMPSEYPGHAVSILWYLDSWECISPDGTVKNAGLEEAVPVQVHASLELQGEKRDWERSVRVCPISDPDEEEMLELLAYQVEAAQEESLDSQVALPAEFRGQRVIWYPEKDRRWIWIAGLTAAALCAMAVGQRKEQEKEREKKERDMQLAYPDIVSRLGLYMGAGISTRKAWERIVESYREQKGGRKNNAYEEMCTTFYEMQSGVPESVAYERFGTRCRLPSYLKLGTLLSQNLRRGTRNLSGLLAEESREAFENRKALAKKMGEECESKLLLPMLLMLLTILVMVMYPAMVSFQI